MIFVFGKYVPPKQAKGGDAVRSSRNLIGPGIRYVLLEFLRCLGNYCDFESTLCLSAETLDIRGHLSKFEVSACIILVSPDIGWFSGNLFKIFLY